MSNRYDICTPNERGGKTYWCRIGSLWMGDDGKPKSATFDALPTASKNRDGGYETRVMFFEPKGQGGGRAPEPVARTNEDDSEIPF